MDKTDEDRYLQRLGFEHELIGRRIGWLLTSQSILFAAYALALNKEVSETKAKLFLSVIPGVGVWVSVVVLLGILAGALAKYHTWRDYQEIAGRQKAAERKEMPGGKETPAGDSTQVYWGVRTYVTMIGLLPDFALPIIFLVAWCNLPLTVAR